MTEHIIQLIIVDLLWKLIMFTIDKGLSSKGWRRKKKDHHNDATKR